MRALARLLSFRGRTSPLNYWRIWLGVNLAIAVLWVVFIFVAMGAGEIAVAPVVLVVPLLIASAAVSVRRMHDRNKSAWWLLVFWVVPIAGLVIAQLLTEKTGEGGPAAEAALLTSLACQLWAVIELGFRRGSPQANRFGPPPGGAKAWINDPPGD
jgi:uncharacterized membrane protein YhaH (DUF805 family)